MAPAGILAVAGRVKSVVPATGVIVTVRPVEGAGSLIVTVPVAVVSCFTGFGDTVKPRLTGFKRMNAVLEARLRVAVTDRLALALTTAVSTAKDVDENPACTIALVGVVRALLLSVIATEAPL